MGKKSVKQKASAGRDSTVIQVAGDLHLGLADFPVGLVDDAIEQAVGKLRKARRYSPFDLVNATLRLGKRLVDTDLSHGTNSVKGQALAWCARFLSLTEQHIKADEYLAEAKGLIDGPEIAIAEAFLSSRHGDKSTALGILAEIDSPATRSAALMIVVNNDGEEKGLGWLNKTGTRATDLDADGKHFLLTLLLRLGLWKEAQDGLNALTDDDLEEAPALHQVSAIILLLTTIPSEYRSLVVNYIPFVNVADFPFASDAESIKTRRSAQRRFAGARDAAQLLDCHSAALKCYEYELWLKLSDPDQTNEGQRQLESDLRDLKTALHLVPLGLQFGIDLNLVAVEHEIDRQVATHGKVTENTASARLALALRQHSEKGVADYIVQHHDELSEFFTPNWLGCLQIELLSRAGFPERANECLSALREDGISDDQEIRLLRIISEAEGVDPVEARTKQYKQTGLLADLMPLVEELDRRKDWFALCTYGLALYEETQSDTDAERYVAALSNAQKHDQVIRFLSDNRGLLSRKDTLRLPYAWALFNEGALVEARAELDQLDNIESSSNLRLLQVNLGIALGDWGYLSTFVANEYRDRENRSANSLIGAAQLALRLNLPDAKALVFAAVEKCDDDAAILAAAYFLASGTEWGDDEEVAHWLHRAAELSGEDGPIQQVTFKGILERKPSWDRLESDIWKQLREGKIPMFLAAQHLNKSLVDFMLFPANSNFLEDDPRHRSVVPAFSGNRQPSQLNVSELTVGIDATALLTLSYLNLLDKALDACGGVQLPHSTMAWLFEEKQKAVFHQPSQITRAHQLQRLLAQKTLEMLAPSTTADSDLSAQIGDALALFIAEAEKTVTSDDSQRVVVRSSPVHIISSLMEEEADLSGHADVMSSCLAVIEKLHQKGHVTAEELRRSQSYLHLHEKPWPDQPVISDGAMLFLDDVSVSYLQHLDLLERIQPAGFRIVISREKTSEANALISYERISDKIRTAIENIRSSISTRIESEQIKISKQKFDDKLAENSEFQHPTFGVFSLVDKCDAVITDDRFLNRFPFAENGDVRVPSFTTLDFLGMLAATGDIVVDELYEYRTLLRRSGYAFIPLTADELSQHLNAAVVTNGRVIETAELKAIRENILQVRMSDWLQLPEEAVWLVTTLNVFAEVVRGLWKNDVDLSETRARANWIADQIDIRGWAHRFEAQNATNIMLSGRGLRILTLFLPPPDATKEVRETFWRWVENRFLIPIKEQSPDLHVWILEYLEKQIANLADLDPTEEVSG